MSISTCSKKKVLLIIAIAVPVLTGLLLSAEKMAADRRRSAAGAAEQAEAGVDRGLSELRERVALHLASKVKLFDDPAYFQGYVAANDTLGFFRDNCWPAGGEKFAVNGDEAVLTVAAVPGRNTAACIRVRAARPPTGSPGQEVFRFYYSYSIESEGKMKRLADDFMVVVRRDNFAKYALFTCHHHTPGGTTVWFTDNARFNGPVHTNESFCFAGNPSARFTQDASQRLQNAYYLDNGRGRQIDDVQNGQVDVPVFEKGFRRGSARIPLSSALSMDELKKTALGGSSDPGSGIRVPTSGENVVGGIYIRGNHGQHTDDASIALSVDGSDRQVLTISQGAAVVTVIVDAAANKTIIDDGSVHTYSGIPDGAGHEGLLVYCTDDIKSLSGMVQKKTKMTVSAERDIVISDSIVYQDYDPSPLSADGYENLLGILSWGGNVRIGTAAPDNVRIHGVIMAPLGVFTVDNYDTGTARGTATLLGGAITDYYGAFGTFGGMWGDTGYGRNFVYDKRMLEGMAPPYFPHMTGFASFVDPIDALSGR